MTTTITIVGENGLDCATQLRNFFIGLHPGNPVAAPEQAKAGVVAPKKTAKTVVVDEEEDAPAPKKKAVKAAVEEAEEDEEDAPAPKKAAAKKPVKKAVDEDEDEEEEAPAPKAKKAATDGKTSVGELKDDGKDQPATVDGCRVMIRRVARAAGCGADYAQAVLAEFGVAGATKVPPKKFQAFIDRCQEVIDDPETIEVEEAE